MAVGYKTGKSEVDASAGNLSRQIEEWSGQVLSFKEYLDAAPDATLEEEMGYTPDDIANLKSAFNDLSLLADIYKGLATMTTARDLGVFSRRLAGLVL